MTDFKPKIYLKEGVRVRTRSFLVVGALILSWVNVGAPTSLAAVSTHEASWAWKGVVPLLSIIVMVLDSIPGDRMKAILVFWKMRDPLPGCRAFSKANLDRDPRINKDRLRELAGGAFPRSAAEQNRLWYQFYRSVENDGRVLGVHKDYLVLRDMTWFAMLLLLVALVSTAIVGSRWNVFAILACVALYLLVRRAAAERGTRFANTVLALISSQHA